MRILSIAAISTGCHRYVCDRATLRSEAIKTEALYTLRDMAGGSEQEEEKKKKEEEK